VFCFGFTPESFVMNTGAKMAMVLADRYRDAANTWERLLIVLEALMGILFHAPKEHCSMILRDLRYALRMLIGSPVFAVVAILSLAIGIGANTAIFAVAKTVLLNTLPVKNAERLRMLTWVNHGREQPVPPVWGDVYTTKDGGLGGNVFSYPVLEELRKKSEVFESLIAFKDVDMTATVDGHPELIATEMVSGGALRALGVEPILGRTLTEADDAGAGAAPAAVITEDYWTEKFGRSAGVLGRIISLNGTPVSIVGVTPAQFTGLTMGSMVRVFLPLTLQPLLTPRAQIIGAGGASLLSNPQSWWVVVMARLRQGVPEAKTQAVLDVVLRQTAKATLPQAKNLDQFHLELLPGSRGLDNLAGFTRPSYLLLGLSGLVLLLACLNLANLLLARAASRQREISTRLALGAGRGGILRQLLTESLLLSLMGGLAGLGCAFLSRNVILELLTDSRDHAGVKADFDLGVLAFTVGLSIAAGVVFGATPIWRAMRADLNSSLKAQRARVRAAREERSTLALSAGRLIPRPSCACSLKNASHATMGRRRVRLGQVLVVMQIALSAILLIGAGLLVRTLVNLNDMPLGFRSDHLLLFKINPPRARYANAQMRALYTQLEQKFATIPGVRQVTISDISLIGDGHSGATFHVSGRPFREHDERVQTNGVGSDFFSNYGHSDSGGTSVQCARQCEVTQSGGCEPRFGKAILSE
jgi:ABC-type antimicrobial peptide transport system permease subunit